MSEETDTSALVEEMENLQESLKNAQKAVADKSLSDVCSGVGAAPKVRLQSKRILKGHIHKVNAVHFAGDSRHLISASLDGKLIIWDTWTGNKVQIIPLRSSWVMAAAFAASGNYVASGGMDNMVTVYDLNNRDSSGVAKIIRELAGYDGFLSCCRFLAEKKLLTGSGDMKICLWDLEKGIKTCEMYGHSGDVVTMSLKPDDDNLFVTGSVDRTAKIWDLRQKSACQTFWGHAADVNSVYFHPSGLAFGTASEDQTARLFDIRADQQVGQYSPPSSEDSGLTSCVLSKSGRFLLAGCDDSNIHVWDVLKSEQAGTLAGHENRITSLTIAENGIAIASSSWDQNVRVWL